MHVCGLLVHVVALDIQQFSGSNRLVVVVFGRHLRGLASLPPTPTTSRPRARPPHTAPQLPYAAFLETVKRLIA